MARYYSRRTDWKKFLSAIVAAALLIGSVAGIAVIFGSKTETISPLEFSVGGLSESGVYLENDQSIYTKNLIECEGLVIEPDFETYGTYQVFYYDSNKNFLGKTDILNAQGTVYTKGDAYAIAPYCRIVITPQIPKDEDGDEIEDFKIHFYDAFSYADDYKITVAKKQSTMWKITGFSMDKKNDGKQWQGEINSKVSEATAAGKAAYDKLELGDADELCIVVAKVAEGTTDAQITVIFTDEDGNTLENVSLSLADVSASELDGFYYFDSVEISKGAAYAYISANISITNMVVLSK